MNETASLERGYRRVLACYPKAFRQENAEEILAVLLASAKEGQRRIEVAECAALIRGGLRMRLRPESRPPRSVRGAVRVMCAGAVVELASVITVVVTAASVRAALAREPGLTAAQWHTAASLLTFKEVAGGLAVALWLFLAWALGHRRDLGQHRRVVPARHPVRAVDLQLPRDDQVHRHRRRGVGTQSSSLTLPT